MLREVRPHRNLMPGSAHGARRGPELGEDLARGPRRVPPAHWGRPSGGSGLDPAPRVARRRAGFARPPRLWRRSSRRTPAGPCRPVETFRGKRPPTTGRGVRWAPGAGPPPGDSPGVRLLRGRPVPGGRGAAAPDRYGPGAEAPSLLVCTGHMSTGGRRSPLTGGPVLGSASGLHGDRSGHGLDPDATSWCEVLACDGSSSPAPRRPEPRPRATPSPRSPPRWCRARGTPPWLRPPPRAPAPPP